MALDAIIISNSGTESYSVTNPLRLNLDGRTADIQVVLNYLQHQGQVKPPVAGDNVMSWASAPKLNGIYLLNYLSKHNFEVELINSFYNEKDRFRRLVERTPKAVVISTTFMYGKQNLRKLVDEIRLLAPDVFIIVGGAFLYLSYLMLQRRRDPDYDTASAKEELLFLSVDDEPAVDLYIISLRGEKILREALSRIRKNQSTAELPNSARLDGKSYYYTQRVDDHTDTEDYAIDWEELPDAIFESGVVPMQASRGCPYDCAFCNFTKDHRLTYIKPIDQLIAELKGVARRGVRYVWFVDDNFRLGKGDLNAVCRRFIDAGVNLQWMTFARASSFQNTDMNLLLQAGCTEIQLGLESADAQILENMNKRAHPDLYDAVLQKLLSSGINCSCYFIFGFPGETDETARRTRDFIKKHENPKLTGNFAWSLYPFVLTPLSPIYEPQMRHKFGLDGYLHKWQHRTMNSERAREHILQTFFELEHSGPIYRGDNQEILRSRGPDGRKQFEATRHQLAKADVKGQLDQNHILKSFQQILSA